MPSYIRMSVATRFRSAARRVGKGCVSTCRTRGWAAYEMRIRGWSSDVCSSDLVEVVYGLVEGFSVGDGKGFGFTTERNGGAVIKRHFRDADFVHFLRFSDQPITRHLLRDRLFDRLRDAFVNQDVRCDALQIGSASCRERVCQYV